MESSLLSLQIAGLNLDYPGMLASGVLGYSAESMHRVIENGAGAVVTKSVGMQPRGGYANPTVVQAKSGLINAMGLPNPGIDVYVEEIKYTKTLIHQPLIVSVFGYSAEEYATVAKKAADAGADALELNVSCPHVRQTGSEIGQNPNLLSEVVKAVKAMVKVPVFVKLSPNVTDIVHLASTAVHAGADALTVVNTLRAIAIDTETAKPILNNIKGGLSGPAMKAVALRCVYDIREKLVDTPIIGCGGISDWQDAVEFFLAGANALQVGTAIAFDGPEVFQTINRGIEVYLRRKHFGSVNDLVGLSHRN
ncbi:MAG: dihydroorotate dehydrogenase [Candidatus Bathyarchaeota archaeon]|nr:dihydroorotate dehydrogenase [Candidatus Termiticorpusculum sp.]